MAPPFQAVYLRHAKFTDCDFSHADLRGTIVSTFALWARRLPRAQKAQIRWTLRGKEPTGG